MLLGGSRRFAEGEPREGEVFAEGNFSFSNSVVDLYWAVDLDEDTRFKIKAGRIETTIPVVLTDDEGEIFRHDSDGEVQHLEANVEYRFPLSRRYGVVTEATYHWVRDEFNPRYLTLTGGLRISF